MSESVFKTTYECGNCGHTWSDEHTPRTDVLDSTLTEPVRVYDRDCEEFGQHNCECCYHVQCPVCELSDDVEVSDRQPITEEDT